MKKIVCLFIIIVIVGMCGLVYAQAIDVDVGFTGADRSAIYGSRDSGDGIVDRTITATLRVSPDGNDTDGLTWENAYTTIQGALNAASTDSSDCTLILVAPHPTWYNINTTGDPTWTGNYEIVGTHRIWAAIKNTHASATSIMKFTGKVSVYNLAFPTQGAVDGLIFTNKGFRVRKCGFNSTATSGANTFLYIDGTAGSIRGGIIQDVQFLGNVAYTKAIHLNNATITEIDDVNIHFALVGVQIENAASDNNFFTNVEIGGSALAFDLDAGNSQHFESIRFHENTADIDDAVGDHHYNNIIGEFPISAEPDNFTGVAVNTGDGSDTWTVVPVVVRAAAATPFKVLGVSFEGGTTEKYRIRLLADGVAFNEFIFEVTSNQTRNKVLSASTNTDFIFNTGAVITAQTKSESAGVDNANIWLITQEL